MNTTLKILATAIPMTFLTACYGPSLTDKDIKVEKSNDNGAQMIVLHCTSDKPIMIRSVQVNNRAPYYPTTTEYMHPMAMAIQPFIMLSRFQPQPSSNPKPERVEDVTLQDSLISNGTWSSEKFEPKVLPCKRGQKEIVVGSMAMLFNPEEQNVYRVKIVTTSHGSGEWNWE